MTTQSGLPGEPTPRFIRYVTITLRLPEHQLETIDAIAEHMHCSPDRIVSRLLESYERYVLTHEDQGRGPAARAGQWMVQYKDPFPTLPIPVSERRKRHLRKQASLERHPGTAEAYLTDSEIEQRQHDLTLIRVLPAEQDRDTNCES